MSFLSTLQELKLQGTKIRDGIVLSQYSQNKWFANNLSIFWLKNRWLCSLVIECRTRRRIWITKVGGLNPSWGAPVEQFNMSSVLFSDK